MSAEHPAPVISVFCASCGAPEGSHTETCMAEQRKTQPPAARPASQPPQAPSADAARFRLHLAERELENAKQALRDAQAGAREQFKADLLELCKKYGYTCEEIVNTRDFENWGGDCFGIGDGT